MKWEDGKIEGHFENHVKGINNSNKQEPTIWKKLGISEIEQYEEKSNENIYSGDSYLYKDYVSKDISINYYNKYDEDYLLTCVKAKNNDLKIYSCF